ncbi:hypothetical protein KT99_02266 [Shewanella benthica KT99]|uniref:Uncharacterized protein n=1 Tax=Shewanella benthica KT99 TaxID=314608 RepID=A9D5L1_9GAMM|nr:hypothetical protein KT99_02266 [Shewanella benthica KT99]
MVENLMVKAQLAHDEVDESLTWAISL